MGSAMHTSSTPSAGSATQRAYDYAKWAVLSAVYATGEVITTGALAHEIGTARQPAHEALVKLEVEGLVRLEPGRGAVVRAFTVQDVEDVLEARVLVENHTAARSFANRAQLLPALERVHEEMKKRRREHDTARFTEADRSFHELIVDAAGNLVLSDIYRMLRERQTLFTSVLMRGHDARMASAIDEHEKILRALRGEDLQAFRVVVNDHLEWSIALARESH